MAYAHYWSRVLEFDSEGFSQFVEDVHLIFSRAQDMGLRLAGPSGKGKPQVSQESVAFNGSASCGHRYRDIGYPWASPTAHGIEEVEPPYDLKSEPAESGGPFLETRVCGGSCAGAPFCIDRKYMVRDWERPGDHGFYDCSCDTHFKPYDLIVTAVLIRAKERLGDGVIITTENPVNGFEDAKRFCRELFGWAARFELQSPVAEILI